MNLVLFAAEAGHGAPNPLAPDYVTMGVTLVVFGLLLAILYAFAWGPILAGLQKREANIIGARDEALAVKREAEQLRASLKAELEAANDKIRGMLEEARRDADSLRAKEREAGIREAQAERDRAVRDIRAERDVAKQELYNLSVDLATLISTKAVRKALSADDHRRLVDEALSELKAAPRG